MASSSSNLRQHIWLRSLKKKMDKVNSGGLTLKLVSISSVAFCACIFFSFLASFDGGDFSGLVGGCVLIRVVW